MVHNIYTNLKHFSALPNHEVEKLPKQSAFRLYGGESIAFETDGFLKYPSNIQSLTEYPLTKLARQVLGIIGSYEIVTNKMIVELLGMLGISTDRDHVLKACERLRKVGLTYSFRFINANTNEKVGGFVNIPSHFAYESLKAMGVSLSGQASDYNVAIDPATAKKRLATNQVLVETLKRNAHAISRFDVCGKIVVSSTDGDRVAVKPSLQCITSENETLIYEVVRREMFWRTTLEEKLLRYQALLQHWDSSARPMPTLIFCCEDFEHAVEVHELMVKIGLDGFLTNDIMLIGSNYERHIYKVKQNGEPEFYRFQIGS